MSVFRWVQRLTAELIDAAGVCRHLYRAVDQHGQVITDRAPGVSIGANARGRHLIGFSGVVTVTWFNGVNVTGTSNFPSTGLIGHLILGKYR